MTIEIEDMIPNEYWHDVLGIILEDDRNFLPRGESVEKKTERYYSLMRYYASEKSKADAANNEDAFQNARNHTLAYLIMYKDAVEGARFYGGEEVNKLRERMRENLGKFIQEFSNHPAQT